MRAAIWAIWAAMALSAEAEEFLLELLRLPPPDDPTPLL